MLFDRLLINVSGAAPTAGNLYTWGTNAGYRTGQGTNVGQTQTPTQIGSTTTWKTVASGGTATVVLKTDGTLWSAGSNADGTTAQGTTTGDTTTFTQIGTDTDWATISVRDSVGMAVKTNGTLWSWGDNQNYSTGQGTNTGIITSPTQIGSDTDWVYATAASSLGGAIKTNGKLYSWGRNVAGGTGQGTNVGDTTSPTQVGTDTDWLSVTAAGFGMLLIKTNGTLWATGYNGDGKLGWGASPTEYDVPTQVGAATNWLKVSTGADYSFLLKSDGTLWSCGNNANGRTGQGTNTGNIFTLTQIGSATDWIDCAASANGSSAQGVARKGTGELWTWGRNNNYQGGTGATSDVLSPTQIGSITTWISISAGGFVSGGIKT